MSQVLQAGHITLTPLGPEHEGFYVALANHPQIRERVNKSHPYEKAQLNDMLAHASDQPQLIWVIAANDKLCGAINFSPLRDAPQVFQGGYWLAPEAWGHGVATTALKLVTEYLFSEKRAVRVQALVEPDNPAAKHVLEKAGYHSEGLLRSFYPTRKRGLKDAYMYARVLETTSPA
jgi:ribosomal-protein-alanine N-acetyltransferase